MAILKALEATAQPPAEIDVDAGFFASITPSVKKFNDDQKINLSHGFLTLIQQIKKTNRIRPPSSNLSTSSYSLYGGASTYQEYQSPEYTVEPRFENL
ncbi:hypothetical protein NQ314_003676 [Rhamnusium bicolor]|uniref:Uncharacterized protein n=1 Tax=Rhamnusium bicolor TaxID=1586634 RepID=A0AAV8ZLI4_9CUCU|nr:hypothetical protein NQ314_003676 [Rhamnusium bicolor]